jgi:hypothetical protein
VSTIPHALHSPPPPLLPETQEEQDPKEAQAVTVIIIILVLSQYFGLKTRIEVFLLDQTSNCSKEKEVMYSQGRPLSPSSWVTVSR